MTITNETTPFAKADYLDSPMPPEQEIALAMTMNEPPTLVAAESMDSMTKPECNVATTLTIPASNPMNNNKPPKLVRMKERRKRRTFVVGIVGGTIGLVLLGPIGAVAGGFGSALITKSIGKRRERRVATRLEREAAAAPLIVSDTDAVIFPAHTAVTT